MSHSGREDSANVSYGLMYRADVLEQLGIGKPATTEEFADMLREFKRQDPFTAGSEIAPLDHLLRHGTGVTVYGHLRGVQRPDAEGQFPGDGDLRGQRLLRGRHPGDPRGSPCHHALLPD